MVWQDCNAKLRGKDVELKSRDDELASVCQMRDDLQAQLKQREGELRGVQDRFHQQQQQQREGNRQPRDGEGEGCCGGGAQARDGRDGGRDE